MILLLKLESFKHLVQDGDIFQVLFDNSVNVDTFFYNFTVKDGFLLHLMINIVIFIVNRCNETLCK